MGASGYRRAGYAPIAAVGGGGGDATAAQAAADAAQATATAAAASAALRPLTTDLASTAAGKGLSLLGLQDAGGLITATNGEAALAELAANIAANTAASPSVATVTIARGGTGQITANGALTALQALTLGQGSLLALADNITNTAPALWTLKHTSSGTAAPGFGAGSAVDLQSGAGTLRRAMTDVTTLTTATNGAEVANRTISLMGAGALAAVLELRPGQVLASVDGNETLPSIGWIGPGGYYGFYRGSANTVGVTRANVCIGIFDTALFILPQSNHALRFYIDVALARNASTGVLDVTAPAGSKYNTGVGVWNHAPPTSQPVGGAATAGGTWTATEQGMLQKLYDMARGAGLLS